MSPTQNGYTPIHFLAYFEPNAYWVCQPLYVFEDQIKEKINDSSDGDQKSEEENRGMRLADKYIAIYLVNCLVHRSYLGILYIEIR